MKPWPIKRVEQKGPTCTIACMAMILGVEFDHVAKHFEFPEEGRLTKIADYLGDHGYSVLIKESMYHAFPRFGFTEMCKPFAPAHVLHLKQFADQQVQHVVVMDQKGKLFDPARENCVLDDFYMLTGVLGIWRPQDL
jgi:hypothetical protein